MARYVSGRGGYGNFQDNQDSSNRQGSARRQEDPTVFLSKTLSSILRHNADRHGLELMKGGYLYVDDILHKVHKIRNFSLEDVHYVVSSNDKQRFTMQQDEKGYWMIRANQGHSVQVEDLELTPIISADQAPIVMHGTYYKFWRLIQNTGLKRMTRNHIHFAAGHPGSNGVISGMRTTCEVIIYIDLDKCLKAGIKFFQSANNVILSPGNDEGVISPDYFLKVMDCHRNAPIPISSPGGATNDTAAVETKSDKKKKKKKKAKDHDRDEHSDTRTEDKSESREDKTTDKPSTSHEATPNRDSRGNASRDEAVSKPVDRPWSETVYIKAVEESGRLVDEVLSQPPQFAVIVCIGEKLGEIDSTIKLLIVLVNPHIYVYHFPDQDKQLMKEGKLDLLLKAREITKVYHNLDKVSCGLIREFDILPNNVPIMDIEMLFHKASLSKLELEKLTEEFNFNKTVFKQWSMENGEFGKKISDGEINEEVVGKLIKRGKLIHKLFQVCNSHVDETVQKKLRGEVYAAAIPKQGDKELLEKIEQLKLQSKQKSETKPKSESKEKDKPVESETAKQSDNQSSEAKGKGGKRNKKRK